VSEITVAADSRSRRAAKRVGLVAKKSRWHAGNPSYNQGGFRLIDPDSDSVVEGETYDLSAQDVIEYCQPEKEAK
jgi:hypothetical protein